MDKPEWLSKGAELLVERCSRGVPVYDVIIVGSGYGGAVAAARLAGAKDARTGRPLSVCLLERGRERVPGTFPNSFSELPGDVRFSRFDEPQARGAADGLFDVRIGKDVTVLVANGLGGGSLVNAGVAAMPEADVFDDQRWPKEIRAQFADRDAMRLAYERASERLGARLADVAARGEYLRVEKHAAFAELAREHRPERARITYDERLCQRCGDCATGCNVGAKSTLSSTYLRRAWEQQAEIYTGATVSHLGRQGAQWTVHFSLTSQPRPLACAPLHTLSAATVILAAGTLGSTELLLRSAQASGLRFSPRLGERFSTNGDMISALYDCGRPVNAAAKESQPLRERQVGPTITGIATFGASRAERVVVEELAIPGALRRVLGEVLTTGAMLASLARRDDHDHPALSPDDPLASRVGAAPPNAAEALAVDEKILDRCQIFAAMGDDGACGRLELVPGWKEQSEGARARDGALRVHWPRAGERKIYGRQDEVLAGLAGDRRVYLRNPLWRPVPPEVSRYFAGAKPSGLLFSVHPLGGCAMGDDAACGVVDHMGRVFDPGGGVHEGLLVLDGSIVPTALGINPLLTITVLAERALELYARERWTAPVPQPKALPALPPVERKLAPEAVTRLRFSERAAGPLRLVPGARPVPAQLDFEFDEIPDVPRFLADGRHLLHGRGNLRLREAPDQPLGPPSGLSGDVQLLVRGASTASGRIWRALWTYARTRLLADARAWRRGTRSWSDLAGLLRGYITLASRVGEVRYLLYDLRLESDLEWHGYRLPAGTRLSGRKTLRYGLQGGWLRPFPLNPWRQLAELQVTAHTREGGAFPMGTLTVDLGYLFRGFASRLRIAAQRDLPAAWMDLASLALFFARVLVKDHFWSFRLPDYPAYDPMRDVRRLPGELPGVRMERHIVGYARPPKEPGIFLPLTRYRREEGAERGPVLLIHGLGASGNQFCTARVQPNLAQYLASAGFDVWVAELRTSIALPYSADQWTIDEVALGDVPRIVDAVLEESGAKQLDVVAHCIGSAMFCSAVLAGSLQRQGGGSKVRSAVLLQVGPLVTLSKGSRLRALAISPLRGLLPAGHLDFSVDDRAGWLESLVDRLLNTYPYPAAEARHHRPGCGGRRARHIANCNRWAAIDGRMISHGKVSPRMLDGLGEVLGHASITTWQQTLQYALLERLTDWQGSNRYVTSENISRFFTFPVRFLHGAENDVFAPLTAWRSRELLRRVHGPRFPAEVVMLPGYSHLDPLIGKAAHRDVYPHVTGFLERAHAPWRADAAEPQQFHVRRPILGPRLGWLRPAGQGWRARVWCRLDDRRSPVSFALVQVCVGGQCRPARKIVPGESIAPDGALTSLVAGAMDTLLCVDVDLGDTPGDYRISVRSAHAAVDDEARAERAHRLAEAAAGMPLSLGPALRDESLRDLLDGGKMLGEASPPSPDSEDEKLGEAVARVPASGDPFTFYVASCRYPGWLVDRDVADEAFVRMRRSFESEPPAALFLVGDQIYADATAGVFDPKDHRQRFYDAYQEAWSAAGARAVLSRVPTYMMMDDHEAGNDWHPQDALEAEEAAMREQGIEAFRRYQWLPSPGNRAAPRRRADGSPAYHYAFDLRGTPVFVCDTRCGRVERREILDRAQFDEFALWLAAQPREAWKVVVSPSVLVPFLRSTEAPACLARSDGWDGFRDSLRGLFSILGPDTNNVVFLCGDAHLSLASEIWFERAGQRVGGTCYCIVASPLYAPYPFANAAACDFLDDNAGRPIVLSDGVVARYRVISGSRNLGGGFTAVSVAPPGPPTVAVHGSEDRRFVLRPGCSQAPAAARLREPQA